LVFCFILKNAISSAYFGVFAVQNRQKIWYTTINSRHQFENLLIYSDYL